ncbi:SDR family oxidoreductase [uncultured Tateyamaria sp.]|uniref:SDR family NAD(P)-dependent oxidoreductase n=1 Tax=uncultured Tateyamaria sp. TaxID=455651 RepID=UPI0026150C31|nr:SDR family NAD(P)-dependent oxidoreductase [uncultured Tateyamaria sp.]
MKIDKVKFLRKYGPWALVTGASDGIGAAAADQIAELGLSVLLVGRHQERLEKRAKACTVHGVDTRAIAADLGTPDGLRNIIAAIENVEVGLYFGSAGFGSAGAFCGLPIDEELSMIDVNCRALTALAYPLAQQMRTRGRGGLILMSSIVAFQGVPHSASYAATKAYVQSLAEGLALELAPAGVDVLASAPGPVATGFASRADMAMSGAAEPDTIARETLAALGRRRTVRPGTQSKLLGYGLGTLPRAMRSRILGNVMRGMTKHRDG